MFWFILRSVESIQVFKKNKSSKLAHKVYARKIALALLFWLTLYAYLKYCFSVNLLCKSYNNLSEKLCFYRAARNADAV